jgi:hypothetical protein
MTDHDRLDEAADQLIAEDEQAEDSQSRVPVREDREGQKRRRCGAQHRADVRHEPQQARKDAPQPGVGNAQQPKTESDQ